MAESSGDQNLFDCPICLHLLKNPVTTTCGHSFCITCLNEFWDRDNQKGIYSCPQCRQTFSPRPALSRNTVLAEAVEKMKREAPEAGTASPVLSFGVSGDVECDICTETKLKAIKSCLACLASYCESHIQTHYTSPALKWHKLVNASPHLLDQICSHHHKLLELYCCKDQQLICMQCALINHQNHSMTSPAAERQKIQCSAEEAVEHNEKMFTELISYMEKIRADITKMIRTQEKAEVSRVEELILALEQEISDLRKRHDDLGQLSLIEDDIHVIQNFSSLSHYQYSDLCNTSVSQRLTFEEMEKVISEIKSQMDDLCQQDIVRISEKVSTVRVMVNNKNIKNYLPSQPKTREEFLVYSVDLNLKAPASSSLSVKHNKSVLKCNNDYLGYEKYYQVLCKEKLSGRCYFEVQWEGACCSIAFSYDNSPTSFVFGSNKKSWKWDFPISNLRVQHNSQQADIPLVSKIGVFLDQAAGTVSFYNVSDEMTLLHRMKTTFTAPLYPGFSFHNLKNDSSVTICDLLNLNK
ncbi:finTRIM family, member 81 isoform X1 [Carassius carassius]|uniref:finTRIM family, member 81 isoform X1 n=1 Tax=Carassius carassius TaxID=217509 RepID=UPI002868C7CE|nr:finTRIM family, member 81 isoform X1 [Carassius carassius]